MSKNSEKNESKSAFQKAMDELRTEQENESLIRFKEAIDAIDDLPVTESETRQPTEAQAPQQEEIRTFGSGSARFQQAMNELADLPVTESEPRQPTELEEEFNKNYNASVDKVADAIDNEIRTNDCFAWTSEVQGATDYELLADVIIEARRRGVRREQAMRGEILGKLEEDAQAMLGAMNMIDAVKSDIEYRLRKRLHTEAGAAYAFFHSDKQAEIIKEMYGDALDLFTFLERVKADGRVNELGDILKRYAE